MMNAKRTIQNGRKMKLYFRVLGRNPSSFKQTSISNRKIRKREAARARSLKSLLLNERRILKMSRMESRANRNCKKKMGMNTMNQFQLARSSILAKRKTLNMMSMNEVKVAASTAVAILVFRMSWQVFL